MVKKSSPESRDELFLLSGKVYSLISAKRYDEARLLIDTERARNPEGEAHRFTALSAILHESLGEIDESITLMRQALQEKPAWIPHLYRLSVMLMDAERWYDANVVLKEIIALSLAKNDVYFLDDCRFRRVICLNVLGRADELEQAKAEIPAGMSAFIGDKLCRIEDILK
jgi:tetratricopeptide (TPR) repeat protein